jgi:hypothetical protein
MHTEKATKEIYLEFSQSRGAPKEYSSPRNTRLFLADMNCK